MTELEHDINQHPDYSTFKQGLSNFICGFKPALPSDPDFSHVEEMKITPDIRKPRRAKIRNIMKKMYERFESKQPVDDSGYALFHKINAHEMAKPVALPLTIDEHTSSRELEYLNSWNAFSELLWLAAEKGSEYDLTGRIINDELRLSHESHLNDMKESIKALLEQDKNLLKKLRQNHEIKGKFNWKQHWDTMLASLDAMENAGTAKHFSHITVDRPGTGSSDTRTGEQMLHRDGILGDSDALRFQLSFNGLSSEQHAWSDDGVDRSDDLAFSSQLTKKYSQAGPVFTAHDMKAWHTKPFEKKSGWRLKIMADVIGI